MVMAGATLAAALGGCSAEQAEPLQVKRPGKNPFPSTYQIPVSAPIHIKNATVLTGSGEQLDGSPLLKIRERCAFMPWIGRMYGT